MSHDAESKKRLLDRSSYPPRTISTFGIIGAYIVDVYYNHLYSEAIKFKNAGTVQSITEGYKHAVLAFLSAVDHKSKLYKPRFYTQLLTGINEYFTKWTSFSTLTLNDCIDKITREFIPEDYYASLDKDQKRNMLRPILINSIKEFTKAVIQEFMVGIIDNHSEPANVEALKDKMTDLLIMEREALYHRFLDNHTGKTTETIDKTLAVRMQQEIKKLVSEKTALATIADDCKKAANLKHEQLTVLLSKYKSLLQKYKDIREEFTEYKNKHNKDNVSAFMGSSEFTSSNQYNGSTQYSGSNQYNSIDSDNDGDSDGDNNESSGNNTAYGNIINKPAVQSSPATNSNANTQVNTNASNQVNTGNTFISAAPARKKMILPVQQTKPSKIKVVRKPTEPSIADMDKLLNKYTKPERRLPQINRQETGNSATVSSADDTPASFTDSPDELIDIPAQSNNDQNTNANSDTVVDIVSDKMKNAIKNIRKTDMGDEPDIGDIY